MVIKSPRFKDKKTRIGEIQAAAKKLFFQRGFEGPPIEEIAKSAGLSKGTIYLYFESKYDLYISLMVPVTEELGRRLQEFENNLNNKRFPTVNEIIMGLFDVYYQVYKYDPGGLRILQAFQLSDLFPSIPEETRERLIGQARKNRQIVRRIISKAKKFTPRNEQKINQFIDVIWGSFIGIMQLEESKFWSTQKDHLEGTMRFAFSLIAKALSSSSFKD